MKTDKQPVDLRESGTKSLGLNIVLSFNEEKIVFTFKFLQYNEQFFKTREEEDFSFFLQGRGVAREAL